MLLHCGLISTSRAKEPARFEFRQTHMGSEFKILLYSTDAAEARRASDLAFARIAALDRALSDYDPESESMRLCDKAGGPPVAVSDDLFRCLERAQAVAEKTDGAFDVTVGPVVRLWRRARRTKALPDPLALEKARSLVGYRNVRLDPAGKTVQLLKPGMKLDFGGIAKGFACDEAIAALKRAGITSALVAGSGDIVASDAPPGLRGWTIDVASPTGDPAHPSQTILLKDAAVSTAGDAEQFVEIGGVRYAHVVDPRTGVGIVSRASVTVVASDGITADSLDTAVYVMGPDRGMPLIEHTPGVAALFVKVGDRPVVARSRSWAQLPFAEASGKP